MSACAAGGGSTSTDWSRTSAASDGGGLQPLVRAAQAEGELDVAGGLGDAPLIDDFESRYRVKVAVEGTGFDDRQISNRQLDVYTIAADTAAAHTADFAPYLVFYWLEIPAALKDPKAYWYESCGGFISVDDNDSQPISALTDLLHPGFRVGVGAGNVAVAAVVTAALASGGSVDNLAPANPFFQDLAQQGGQPPNAFFEWNYDIATGRRHFTPAATVAAYDVQAINRAAPHPAAARLWEEYLFSDAGQNLCVKGGAQPSRLEAMRTDGVLDVTAAAALDPVPRGAVTLTPEEMAAARAYVAARWGSVVAGQ